jgi:hypothetical protein
MVARQGTPEDESRELMEDTAMLRSERQGLTRRQGLSGWRRRSGNWSRVWILAGVAVLAATIVISTTGCSSNSQANSSTTAATVAAGQTGTPGGTTGAPSGAPAGFPSGAGGPTTPPGGASTTTSMASPPSSDSTTSTEVQTTTTTVAEGAYSDGIYLAGTDIDSGLYHGAVNGDKGHWEISSDANGDKFVASGDPTGPFYVKVTYGQYLRLSGVTIEEASSTAADPLVTSNITDGTYRVGYDIAVGWYKGTLNGGMGYWEVSSDANGQTLVASEYPLGPFTVKVKSGQYLTLRGVTVSQ